jgi:hypothetical protein
MFLVGLIGYVLSPCAIFCFPDWVLAVLPPPVWRLLTFGASFPLGLGMKYGIGRWTLFIMVALATVAAILLAKLGEPGEMWPIIQVLIASMWLWGAMGVLKYRRSK